MKDSSPYLEILDSTAAKARLQVTIRDFLQGATISVHKLNEIRRAYHEDTSQGFELLLDTPIEQLFPYPEAVVAAAGLGKTSMLIKELLKFPGTVWFQIPNMTLAAEVERDFGTAGHPHVYLYRGRNSNNCTRFDLTKELTQYITPQEQSIGQSLCKQGDKFCPYYDGCPYIEQLDIIRNAPQPAIIIMAHNCLTVRMQIPAPDLVVVDESHWQVMIEIKSIKTSRLYELASYKPQSASKYLSLVTAILTALQNQPCNYLQALRDAGIKSKVDLEPAVQYIAQLKRDIKPISPEQSDEKIKETLRYYSSNSPILAKVSAMLEALGQELAQKRHIGHLLKYDNAQVKVHSRKNPRQFIPSTTPVLLLDASADEAINRQVWGKELKHLPIPVRRQVTVHQVIGRSFSKQSILGKDSGGRDWHPEDAARLRDEIVNFVNNLPGRIFVAATKKILEVLQPLLKDEVLTAHFSTLRGRNKFQDCDTAVIIGREQPNPKAIEAYARALRSDASAPLNLAGDYINKPRPLHMRNGEIKNIPVYIHPDDFIQSILEQIREQENMQALDRLRLVHLTKPKTVYNLNSVVIPGLPVDYVHRWPDLIKGGSRIERALARIYTIAPAFPLGQTELARLFPDLWPSADAVKRDIARHGGIKWVEDQIISTYMQNDPFIRIEYRRPGQRGKASPAIISANILNLRQALEDVVGEVVCFLTIAER